MAAQEIDWLDAVIEALAKVRATLASFGSHDRVLDARIDAAMQCAHMLRSKALRGDERGKSA